MFLTREVGFDHRVRVLHSNWGGQRLDDIYYRIKVQTQTRCELNVLHGKLNYDSGSSHSQWTTYYIYIYIYSSKYYMAKCSALELIPDQNLYVMVYLSWSLILKSKSVILWLETPSLIGWETLKSCELPNFCGPQKRKDILLWYLLRISETRRPFFFFLFFLSFVFDVPHVVYNILMFCECKSPVLL